DGQTPLHLAVEHGYLDIAKTLIKKGVYVNDCTLKGETPLHLVAKTGYLDMARLLIQEKADVNMINNKGNTPLHQAVSLDYLDMVKLFIEAGADVNKKNNKLNAPIHLAVWGRLKMMEELIKSGADLLAKNKSGEDAYSLAMKQGQVKVAKMIKEAVKEKMMARKISSYLKANNQVVLKSFGAEREC
ncbi:MAG: ankyrin repeat domain-containing protein, partial [Alphaproteobacteria bacterium]|nr:ankyrin repeat domain-containing protein [Alphaproteobacteria bacterium]